MAATLNERQKHAYDIIMAAIDDQSQTGKCHFLDGPGGSGKTYLYETLLSTVRGRGQIALAIASIGIAANLLSGGRTSHSQFKLSVPLNDRSTSSMRLTSDEAQLIREASIIIWDEATMAPNDAYRYADQLLRDIMQNGLPFGGKVYLLGGDFRQTLPVVPRGNRQAIVEACVKRNNLWRHFQVHKLRSNERSDDPEFSDWLIKLGDGQLINTHGLDADIF